MTNMNWKKNILTLLSPPLREIVGALEGSVAGSLEEIRLRAGKPLMAQTGRGEVFLGRRGPVDERGAYVVTGTDLHAVLLLITEYSLYARDEELKRGYLALPGGHRAGFAGRAVLEENRVKLLRDISGINLRIAREIKGVAKGLLEQLYYAKSGRLRHTLIVSAPQAGKTTMLRDLARLISDGDGVAGRRGFKVGIVDERSEIAGCYLGEPQLDVGLRSDVLDGCPKAEGMMMLVRSMSPEVVVTDEIGRPEDARAIEDAVNTGAVVLATAHGKNALELLKRPSLAYLLENQLFERIVVLSRRRGPGTIEGVFAGEAIGSWKQAGG